MPVAPSLRIAIVGAGPAGLTLASILQHGPATRAYQPTTCRGKSVSTKSTLTSRLAAKAAASTSVKTRASQPSQRSALATAMRLYLGFKTPESWAKDSDVVHTASDHECTQILIQTRYTDCDNRLHPTSWMVAQTLYALPLGHTWTHRAGVTLIGDAAHLMSPCACEGVNVAMLNMLQLAKTIVTTLQRTTPIETVAGMRWLVSPNLSAKCLTAPSNRRNAPPTIWSFS